MVVCLVDPCQEKCSSINDQKVPGFSEPLLQAIESGNLTFCERLLDAGADPDCNLPTCQSCTALTRALHAKKPEIAQLLISRGASHRVQTCDHSIDGERISTRGYSPQHFAAALVTKRYSKTCYSTRRAKLTSVYTKFCRFIWLQQMVTLIV